MATARRLASLATPILVLLALGPGKAFAVDRHLGEIEYEIACMSCHGLDGRGTGPEAKNLQKAPADLTGIARSNKGQFPADRISEMIDGRAYVASHGQRDMPVWGDRYRVRADPTDTDKLIEHRAREQIDALVAYIRSIQRR